MLTPQFYIRTATVADLPAVERLLRAAWHAAYDGIHGADKIEATSRAWHSPAKLKTNLERPWSEFLLADTGAALAGVAYAAQASEDFITLHQLYIDPALTGRGIGTQLLEAVFDSFPEARAFRLEVDAGNPRAAAFYARHGFRETGRTPNCGQHGSGMASAIMEKRL
ncbi:MAG: GNAT family N-acetyltransferase [Rhizobiaceae bacterium]